MQEETLTRHGDFLLIALVHLFMVCVINKQFNTWNMWFVMRMLFFPLSVITILCSCLYLRKKNHPILRKLGKITLELYLLHEWILYISTKIIFKYVGKTFWRTFLLNVIAAAVAVLLAQFANNAVNRIRSRIVVRG